ncbi:uncharacterized protein LOC117178291 [Belonocnema kinseyi]|uniref:uncharacterized protein LOC117178291 n=1 Tax=Belonocnema kinseyi TaxID=2817044 RepID=UPI00143CE148|nr:uncharacterized protein LOC117178291 [Belonocnema kinseyi]
MPAKIATKRLQEENLLLTDFIVAWKQCMFEIQEVNTSLAKSLVKNMETRLQTPMESEVLLAAMLLDLRVCTLLTIEQEEQAIQHLRKLWNKLQSQAKRVAVESNEPAESTINENEQENTENSASQKLATLIQQKYLEKHQGQEGHQYAGYDIAIALRSFSHQPPRSLQSSVLTYWKEDRYKWPELFSLAMIVLATPATQVSVERLFSAMKFIFSVYRSSLKGNIVDAILVIRCNKDIFGSNGEAQKNKKLKLAPKQLRDI